VSRQDWSRNTSWNSEIENALFKKLARARDKSQYLRIQACTLAPRYPAVALRLLDHYFSLANHFDTAQAHVDRATAHLHLHQLDAAVLAYEAALAHETSHPSYRTQAYIELPFLIATERLSRQYDRAIALLEAQKNRLTFPLERFRWHCAVALITVEDHAVVNTFLSSTVISSWRWLPR
jgi:tetratricopeptide (TPR) repeat protein